MTPFIRYLYAGSVRLRCDGFGYHVARVRDGKTGPVRRVPSVNRVLSDFNKNGFLAHWAQGRTSDWLEDEMKRSRRALPHVGDWLEDESKRGSLPRPRTAGRIAFQLGLMACREAELEVERFKAAVIRDWMQKYAKACPVPDRRRSGSGWPEPLEEYMEFLWGTLKFEEWTRRNRYCLQGAQPVASMRHGYAGCVDLLTFQLSPGLDRREPDLTGRQVVWVINAASYLRPEHVQQVTACALARHEEYPNQPRPLRGVLLFPFRGSYSFIPHLLDDDEFDEDAEAFLGGLKATERAAALKSKLRYEWREYEKQRESGDPWYKANPGAARTVRTLRCSAGERSEGKENEKR